MPLTALDLFSGCGGMSSGLSRAGVRVLAAVDSWSPAVATYRLNFRHPILQEDISALSVERFSRLTGLGRGALDLIVGGPPCQGFSIQRIGSDVDGRNDLIFDFGRFVAGLRPRLFVMENVPGLLGKRGRALADRLMGELSAEGYELLVTRVNAADYGVPQVRNRVIICGYLAEGAARFAFPTPMFRPEEYRTVWEAIGDLPSPPADCSPTPGDPLHRRMRISALNLERLRHIPPGGGFEALPVALRVDCHKDGADRIGHRFVYGRLGPDEPAGVITAKFDSFTRGKFAHPFEDRNITLREGARLQTFPDEFAFAGSQEEIAAMIGNAVPPLLAEVVGKAIVRHLGQSKPRGARRETKNQLRLFGSDRG